MNKIKKSDCDSRLQDFHQDKLFRQKEGGFPPPVDLKFKESDFTVFEPNEWFDNYVEFVKSMKIYPGAGTIEGIRGYALPALAEEIGELSSIFAKAYRDKTEIDLIRVNKEAGDIIFDVICVLTDAGINPADTIDWNRIKLQSRKNRGVVGGSGDDR